MTKQAKLPTASLLLALTAAMQSAENIRLENVDLIDRIKAEGQKQVTAKNAADDAVKVTYDLAPMDVDREHALPLGLVANEVVSNAMKYAFQDNRDGSLVVTLKKTEDGRMGVLTIHDNGTGFDPETSSKGTGSKLISGLAAQIQGETGYTFENGTKFEMRFPLPKSA